MIPPFQAGPALSPALFQEVRLRTIFDCCKWDPQVGDQSILAPFPILLDSAAWAALAGWTEVLARETLAAESEILCRPELLKSLGLPRPIWKLLASAPPSRSGPRIMRFDFHFTSEGWKISEVNSDVPGGLIEADGFSALVAGHFPGWKPAGRPTQALAQTLAQSVAASSANPNPAIALVHATAYSDDRQVVACLARHLQPLGVHPVLVGPQQITWPDGQAEIQCQWFQGPASACYRFFPAEWLPNLRRTAPWQGFFAHALTPQSNPAWALLSQSKRFGILLDRFETALPAWRSLLPETRHPRFVSHRGAGWVLKPALGRVGEGVGIEGITPRKEYRTISSSALLFPGAWVAQRRFDTIPIATPGGLRFCCFGVYAISGKAAGIYARCGSTPVIGHSSQDVAVLIPIKDHASQHTF